MAIGDAILVLENELIDPMRFCGDSGDGESGELGDGEVDLDVTRRKAGLLEGDWERECRSCLIVEFVSTWCMWAGEG